jgi:hypothetical protein
VRGRGVSSALRTRSVLAAGVGALALALVGGSAASAAPVTKGIPGWGYELVTPASTAGQESSVIVSSPSGDQVVLDGRGGFADVDSLATLGTPYRARRTPTGWQTATLGNPPPDLLLAASSGSMDVERGWWLKDAPRALYVNLPTVPTRVDQTDTQTVLVGSKGGPWNALAPEAVGIAVRATTRDLSSVLFTVTEKLALTDGTEDTRSLGTGRSSLILSKRNPDGTLDLRQIARQGGVSMFPDCSIALGGTGDAVLRGAVNREDLSRVIFTVEPGGPECAAAELSRVWASEPFSDSPDVVEISATECDDGNCGEAAEVRFVGGALDVSRVYMTTTQKLVNSDAHAGTDIYEYDFRKPEGQRLSLVTGNSTASDVVGVQEVSDDGSRVFFVATGDLDDAVHGDVGPVAGSQNLYVRMDDPDGGPAITRFIATLSASDWVPTSAYRSGSSTADGRYFTFSTNAHITADKQPGDNFTDAYRYDVDTGELVRLWTDDPARNGANRVADAYTGGLVKGGVEANYESRTGGRSSLSDDGSAITFFTSEPLVSGDLNGTFDTFVWRAETGDIAMVSDGKDLRGVFPNAISPDGSTVFFKTVSQIVPQHTSSSEGVYAYRPGGGFALPPTPAAPCEGDECQGQGTAPGDQRLGSVEFVGAGNVAGGADRVRASVTVSKVKAVVGSAGRLTVRVPAAGRITVGGASVRGASRSASKAGRYSVRVALSAKARKALAKRKSLKVRVRVSYRTRGGQGASRTVVVTFQRLSAKPGSVRKGGK